MNHEVMPYVNYLFLVLCLFTFLMVRGYDDLCTGRNRCIVGMLLSKFHDLCDFLDEFQIFHLILSALFAV